MGSKVKPRQRRKPRNMEVLNMLTTRKGGPMRDKREKRVNRRTEERKKSESGTDGSYRVRERIVRM